MYSSINKKSIYFCIFILGLFYQCNKFPINILGGNSINNFFLDIIKDTCIELDLHYKLDTKKITIYNIKIFKSLYNIFGLKLCGIDLIIPDIRKSYKYQKYSILELNSNPSLMHYHAIDKSNKIMKKFLQLYFNKN